MREDKASPKIAKILVVDSSILLVADSANRCIKSVVSLPGERDCRLHRLDLDTRPRGMALLKTHIAVVSGRQSLHIITIVSMTFLIHTYLSYRCCRALEMLALVHNY